jgi:hypothetical protein
MVRGQYALDDGDPDFLAGLSGNLANSLPDRARQHLLAVLGDPNEIITIVFMLKLSV